MNIVLLTKNNYIFNFGETFSVFFGYDDFSWTLLCHQKLILAKGFCMF